MKEIVTAADFAALKAAGAARHAAGFIVHFGAEWCEPCASLTRHLDEVWATQLNAPTAAPAAAAAPGNADASRVGFYYAPLEKAEALFAAESVDSVPHLVFFRCSSNNSEGAAMAERVGEVSGAKLAAIDHHIASLYLHAPRAAFAALDDYLRHLIRRARVVAFITGTPSQPRCGFTGKLLELLDTVGLKDYAFYDVMESDEVCQGLKRFSSWPTFPQVYVDGELIGGLDACRQLHEAGELKAALKL